MSQETYLARTALALPPPNEAKALKNEQLERRISHQLNVIASFLSDETLLTLLHGARLREIIGCEEVLMDKLLELRGRVPTGLMPSESLRIDLVAATLIDELKRRGITAQLTERKIELKAEPDNATAQPNKPAV